MNKELVAPPIPEGVIERFLIKRHAKNIRKMEEIVDKTSHETSQKKLFIFDISNPVNIISNQARVPECAPH